MKWLGKKSVASVLKWINDFFLVLFSLGYLGMIILFSVRFSKDSYNMYDWPIELDPKFTSHSVNPTTPGKEVIEITSKQYEISFHTERDWATIVYILIGGTIALAWMIRFLWLIRQRLRGIGEQG